MKIYHPLFVTSPPLQTTQARSGPIVATREIASNTNATPSLCLLFSVPFEIYVLCRRPLLIFRPKLHRPLGNTNIASNFRLSCLPYMHSFVLFGNSIPPFSLFSYYPVDSSFSSAEKHTKHFDESLACVLRCIFLCPSC